MKLTVGGSLKPYLYNANQELVGHIANGKTYFYLKNAQGDIQAVINEEGLCVKIYVYSAWGKEIDREDPDLSAYTNDSSGARLGSSISNYYRGYEMDNNLYCYYLQSRYYDPYSQFRFINADIPQIAQQNKNAIHGMNLFAYCADNPVMFSDPTGYDTDNRIGIILKSLFSALFIDHIMSLNLSGLGKKANENLAAIFASMLVVDNRAYHWDLNGFTNNLSAYFEKALSKFKTLATSTFYKITNFINENFYFEFFEVCVYKQTNYWTYSFGKFFDISFGIGDNELIASFVNLANRRFKLLQSGDYSTGIIYKPNAKGAYIEGTYKYIENMFMGISLGIEFSDFNFNFPILQPAFVTVNDYAPIMAAYLMLVISFVTFGAAVAFA